MLLVRTTVPLVVVVPTTATDTTHALVGTTSGKIVLYKKRDWSVQHVLSGHNGEGAGCIAVHPTGRMALSVGRDGKINLWDLVKGRLEYVHKLPRIARGHEAAPGGKRAAFTEARIASLYSSAVRWSVARSRHTSAESGWTS